MAMRKQLVEAGLDAGPASIAFHLPSTARGAPCRRRRRSGGSSRPGVHHRRPLQGPQAMPAPVHRGTGQRVLADRRHRPGRSPMAPRSRSSTSSTTTAACWSPSVAMPSLHRRRGPLTPWPAPPRAGLAGPVPVRQRQAFRHVLADAARRPRRHRRPLPALSPPDQRQGRTVPPDPQTLARRPRPAAHTLAELQAQLDVFRHHLQPPPTPPRPSTAASPPGLGRTPPRPAPPTAPRHPHHHLPRHRRTTAPSAPAPLRASASAPPTTANTALAIITGTRLPRLHRRPPHPPAHPRPHPHASNPSTTDPDDHPTVRDVPRHP